MINKILSLLIPKFIILVGDQQKKEKFYTSIAFRIRIKQLDQEGIKWQIKRG